ncbi:MAG: NAD(P)H-hydrate dehydratase [Lactobacillaceae bacterium]|nr:NAD(P)H-hydrate dehydratase [Lactobacillaceae bacterium]
MITELKSDILHEVIQKRPVDSNKTNFGRVLLIGGNKSLGGAILLAAAATVNAGAGLTTVATDPTNIAALHVRTPEAMAIDWNDAQQLGEQLEKSDVILIGPGLGRDDLALQLLQTVIFGVHKNQKLIVDGDGLTLMAQNNIFFPTNTYSIATPHQGEWESLSNIMVKYQSNMMEMNELQRQNLNLDVLVIKQHHTLIMSEDRQMQLQIGGPYQATGGMGDTLAGMVAGFVAQFAEPRRATEAAVYAHTAIAEQLAAHNWVVKPSLVADFLPNYMSSIQTNLVGNPGADDKMVQF